MNLSSKHLPLCQKIESENVQVIKNEKCTQSQTYHVHAYYKYNKFLVSLWPSGPCCNILTIECISLDENNQRIKNKNKEMPRFRLKIVGEYSIDPYQILYTLRW
jgi:hypothetical protein